MNVEILCAMREPRKEWWATDETLGNPSECTGGTGQRDRERERTRETMFKKSERVKSLKKAGVGGG